MAPGKKALGPAKRYYIVHPKHPVVVNSYEKNNPSATSSHRPGLGQYRQANARSWGFSTWKWQDAARMFAVPQGPRNTMQLEIMIASVPQHLYFGVGYSLLLSHRG
jgi:hypothetical protein